MIRLHVPFVPSRHKRLRAKIAEILERDPNIKQIGKGIEYRVEFQFYGRFKNKNGTPKARDPDSAIIPILDAIADAAGLAGDHWINRSGSWSTHESDEEYTLILIT